MSTHLSGQMTENKPIIKYFKNCIFYPVVIGDLWDKIGIFHPQMSYFEHLMRENEAKWDD